MTIKHFLDSSMQQNRRNITKSENPIFPSCVFHLKSKLPSFPTLFFPRQIFSPPLQVWHTNRRHYILKYIGSLNIEKKNGIFS